MNERIRLEIRMYRTLYGLNKYLSRPTRTRKVQNLNVPPIGHLAGAALRSGGGLGGFSSRTLT